MKYRFLLSIFALFVLATALGGCSTDNNESQRLVCEVASVNAGVPLVSAYLNSGNDKIVGTEDDYLPIDWVPILFKARPLNSQMVLPENGTYSWFHITSYDLVWHPGPAAPDSLSKYNVTGGLIDAIVPVDDEAVVNVMVSDRTMKEELWFRQIYYSNYPNPVVFPDSLASDDPNAGSGSSAFLEFTFHGHETGSEHEVAIPAGLSVFFYGAVSSN